jgi:hypothetical protein
MAHAWLNTVKHQVHLSNIKKNSVHTAKKTQHFSITKMKWLMLLMLFRVIIAVSFWDSYQTQKYTLRAKCRVTER